MVRQVFEGFLMFGMGTTKPDNTDVDEDDKEMVKSGERAGVFVSVGIGTHLHSIAGTPMSNRR